MIDLAIKIANRSSIRTHKTGCVIVRGGEILSVGWSHVPPQKTMRSLHAEMHALARGRHLCLNYATAYVATVNGKSGNVVNGRPCLHCAIAMRAAGIRHVHYTSPTLGDDFLGMLYLEDELKRHNLKVYRGLDGET